MTSPFSPTNDPSIRRRIAIWLLACCLLVFLLVVIGGITRLTRSGLSIVEWQPLVGTIPPLNDAQWETLFEKYRQTPEFRLVNFDIDIEGFKRIFWWEYFHRLLGRLIGAAFLAPYLYFLLRRAISGALAWKLGAIFVLGALQGALGWFMVKSGLVDDPRVSPYRLTAHLGLALMIFAAMFWVALDLLRAPGDASIRTAGWPPASLLAALVFIMALSGGLVAGLRAGYAYNTFPLMNGHVLPPDLFLLDPWYSNFFINLATVQFDHRLLAWVLVILVPIHWWRARHSSARRARRAADLLFAVLCVQVALGIATLLLVVPIALAAAHQAGAVVMLAAALYNAHLHSRS